MSDTKLAAFDWAFYFQWIMATTLGWVLAQALLPAVALLAAGPAVALFQWLLLRHQIKVAWRWVAYSTIGWTIGVMLILTFVPPGLEILIGPAIGVAVGVSQWMILREEVHWANWWLVLSTISWTIGLSLLPGLLLTGSLAGSVTGIALELLLRYPLSAKHTDND